MLFHTARPLREGDVMQRNPYEPVLLLASKQALLTLSEIGKMLGKSITEMVPALQLMQAISDYEKWNKDHPVSPTPRTEGEG